MLSDDEPGKHLDDHTITRSHGWGVSTKPWDEEQWDGRYEQTALLCERLLLAWQTTLELLDQRYQIAQNHQDLLRQRQRLLEQQAVYLQDIPPFY